MISILLLIGAFAMAKNSAPEVTISQEIAPRRIVTDAGAGGYQAFPDICRLKNGDLFCVFYAGYTHISQPNAQLPNGGRVCAVRSHDDGKTWGQTEIVVDTPLDDRDPSVVCLPDGTLLCSFFTYGRNTECDTCLVRSTDSAKTWTAPEVIAPSFATSSPIRRLRSGRLVLPVYNVDGNGKRAYSAVCLSDDRGKTWSSPHPIGLNAGRKLDETDVFERKDGTLLAVMREVMCGSLSNDGGKTWGPVYELGFPGHCPYLLQTPEGVLLMAHRLPQTSLHYSVDEGRTWHGPVLIDSVIGAYPSMIMQKDGRVLCVYYEEGANSAIRAVTLKVTRHDQPEARPITTVAGTGQAGYSGHGGLSTNARLNEPFHVCFGPNGEMYIADASNHCIRRVEQQSGQISTVAGCGRKGYSGDGGLATAAAMNEPYGVVADSQSNLYIVDRLNACIRYVEIKSGLISTLAGTGKQGYGGDGGPAKQAQLREPNGLALDGHGALYIADVSDNRIRKVDLKTGIITTVCGTGLRKFAGDGGLAVNASIDGARAVDVDRAGNIYICEREGNRIRKINAKSGIIRTIAGTGTEGYSGDNGTALMATFNGPKWVSVDSRGMVYVVDTENHCVRRIDQKTGIITTIAGCGQLGDSGDGGPAKDARMNRPHGCIVHNGILYIADTENHRVRACPVSPN